jgi:hypothetical protein
MRAIARWHNLSNAAPCPHHYIVDRHNPMPQHELDERPRRTEDRQTEIPPRQGANICALVTHVLCDPDGHGPGFGKISLEAGENLTECLEAAGQQAVWVSILGGTGARSGIRRKAIAFKDFDLFEIIGQHTRDRQTTDAATDHHRAPAEETAHAARSTSFGTSKSSFADYN